MPAVVITTDGRVLAPGGVREMYPGPLVPPVVERPISPKGIATLLQAAKDAGILGVGDDFTGGAILIGGAAARLQIAVDGVTYDLVGDANAAVSCPLTGNCPDAVPGTPAAFTRFWHRVLDLAGWLEPELGPEQAHGPASYAVIVGPPPEPWPNAVPAVWPATGPALDAFGAPVRGEPGTRCGVAAGDLAAALRPFRLPTDYAPVATARQRDPRPTGVLSPATMILRPDRRVARPPGGAERAHLAGFRPGGSGDPGLMASMPPLKSETIPHHVAPAA
jgi:hypothetical protein